MITKNKPIKKRKALARGRAISSKITAKKEIAYDIINNITYDRLTHNTESILNILNRLEVKFLKEILEYTKDYYIKNNEKISFLRLGCYIDKLKLKKT